MQTELEELTKEYNLACAKDDYDGPIRHENDEPLYWRIY